MNIDVVKREIADNVGKKHHFVFCGVRGQIEEFDGIIIKMFPAIFLKNFYMIVFSLKEKI